MAEGPKHLYRSRKERKLLGVMGGLAEYTGLDPSFLRLVYLFFTVTTAFVPGVFLYLAMAWIVPLEAKEASKA